MKRSYLVSSILTAALLTCAGVASALTVTAPVPTVPPNLMNDDGAGEMHASSTMQAGEGEDHATVRVRTGVQIQGSPQEERGEGMQEHNREGDNASTTMARPDFATTTPMRLQDREELRQDIRLFLNSSTTASTTLRARIEAMQQTAEQRRQELEQQAQDRRQALEQRRQETASSTKARVDQRRQDVIKAYADRMTTRLNAAIDRQSKLADRIASRIQKIQTSQNIDLSDATALLAQARAQIGVAQAAVTNISVSVDETLAASDPKQAFQNVITATQEAVQSIQDVHQAFVAVVTKLSAELGTNTGASASTTVTASTTTS